MPISRVAGLNGVGITGLNGHRRVLRRPRPAHHWNVARRTAQQELTPPLSLTGMPIPTPDFAGVGGTYARKAVRKSGDEGISYILRGCFRKNGK